MLSSCELNKEQTAALVKLIEALPEIIESLDNPSYDEIYGYRINTDDKEHVNVPIRDEILNKFLAASQYNVTEAIDKVKRTLNWRNKFQPLHAAFAEKHDERLHLLGVITEIENAPKPNMRVATWNLYANLKNPKALFDDFAHKSNTVVDSKGAAEGTDKPETEKKADEKKADEKKEEAEKKDESAAKDDAEKKDESAAKDDAEKKDESAAKDDADKKDESAAKDDADKKDESAAKVDADKKDEPATEASETSEDKVLEGSPFLRWRIGLMEKSVQLLDFTDPKNNRVAQIHDYNNVSMWRMDPGMKRATKEIVLVFGDNYPELLSSKFFVNVATLMLWVFTFFSRIGVIGEETRRKFVILNKGNVADYFGADALPTAYNGGAETTVELIESIDVQARLSYPEYAVTMGLTQ